MYNAFNMINKQDVRKGFFSSLPRSSGVLLHLTSLPGAYGIGDLGPGAFRFVDFLKASDQKYWQILPYGFTDPGSGNSPYTSFSAFAGNQLLISPELMVKDGLLDQKDLEMFSALPENKVLYKQVINIKTRLFRKAFSRFQQSHDLKDFDTFCSCNAAWLDDYSLFMALKSELSHKDWSSWPLKLARREAGELDRWRGKLSNEILYQQFLQYCFDSQWKALKKHSEAEGVGLIGDLPIYVSYDSADVWSNPHLFDLDAETLRPIYVAGVPPDYFSETGQRWGNPTYRWITQEDGKPTGGIFKWWALRLRFLLEKLDIVRVDHFRGFEAYWEIPAEEKTAVNGRWVKGPGIALFEFLEKSLHSDLPIIAEDLGVITPEVEMLRDKQGFPGMKVLQFAFDSGPSNQYLPFNYATPDCVVYTGTHDNDTTRGWFVNALSREVRSNVIRYLQCDDNEDEISWQMIRYAFSSTAKLAIIPMQDLLSLPGDCRMNTPGRAEGNWTWRCRAGDLSDDLKNRLAELTRMFGR